MTRYTATFSTDDEITRTSHNDYTHAWAVIIDGEVFRSGFSATRDGAQKSGNRERVLWAGDDLVANIKKSKTPTQRMYRIENLERMGGAEAYNAQRQAKLASMTVEVTEAIRA